MNLKNTPFDKDESVFIPSDINSIILEEREYEKIRI